ncbi:hypothetical protein C9374_007276 [Naegleria lovaniensis]|uniref:Carbohydrate kinase PfkB domain-containing protein n=1 Tax=Naegleria lovaniensis TaxID=51637 RepID=A0AA88KY67_NAELO|nr:uncharacterized protein C9374_007276 [Naegleria lovaniensis]KAG2393745.1 hypothetical protein C9374_007276 [Naegleria lovaniensis]
MKFSIHCLGVMTMDYLAIMNEFPIPNSKMRTSSMEMHGGGNAANVVFHLIQMMREKIPTIMMDNEDQYTTNKPNKVQLEFIEIALISKIGNDVVGKAIYEEFAQLQCHHDDSVERTTIDLNLNNIVKSPSAQSAFSFIMITPNKQSGNDRTIINTPLSEEFSFSELTQQQKHANIDILFLDGRYSSVAISYVNTHTPKYVMMECERMRPTLELNTFLELITKSHSLFLSENFPMEYLNYVTQLDRHDSLNTWINQCISQDGYDARLISMHLLFSQLSCNNVEVPTFITCTLGSKGSIGMILHKEEEHSLEAPHIKTMEQLIQDKSSSQSDKFPQTTLSTFSLSGPSGENFQYALIYCTSHNDSKFPNIVDTTGAGDAFNAGMVFCMSRFLMETTHRKEQRKTPTLTIYELGKALKFANISAFYTCTGVGARGAGIDHEKAEKLWNELEMM